MPDDTLEITEQEEDVVFALEAEGKAVDIKPEQEQESKQEQGSQQEQEDKKLEPVKEPEQEQKEEPKLDDTKEKEPTVEERIVARGKELGTEKVDKDPLDVKPTAKELEEKIQPDGKLTKEDIARHLNSVSDDQLPEDSIIIGNEEIDLREFRDSFPEQWAAVKVISSIIAQKAIEENASFANKETVEEQREAIVSMLWWDEVKDVHADAKKIAASDEFSEWLDKSSKTIQRMAAPGAPASDAILVLDYYKEGIAAKKVKEHDDKLAKNKQARDDLHSNTIREKTSTATNETQEFDEDAIFEAEARRA